MLYTTDLHAYPAVGVHVLAAGYLFTASVVGMDPAPHRARLAVRATTLVLVSAVHGILAKQQLYAGGWGTGAMVMYYGGDVIELAPAALLCRELLADRPRSAARGWSTARPG